MSSEFTIAAYRNRRVSKGRDFLDEVESFAAGLVRLVGSRPSIKVINHNLATEVSIADDLSNLRSEVSSAQSLEYAYLNPDVTVKHFTEESQSVAGFRVGLLITFSVDQTIYVALSVGGKAGPRASPDTAIIKLPSETFGETLVRQIFSYTVRSFQPYHAYCALGDAYLICDELRYHGPLGWLTYTTSNLSVETKDLDLTVQPLESGYVIETSARPAAYLDENRRKAVVAIASALLHPSLQ